MQTLHWDASYEIVLALIEHYPRQDLELLSLDDLESMILQLPGFADDPTWVNDAILRAILRDWYEETLV